MKITIEDLQKRISINPATITRAAKKTLLFNKVKGGELSLVFVTDQRIKSLNKKFLKREYTTDVLSFDLKDPTAKPNEFKGEIVISTDTAIRNARVYGTTTQGEIDLYVVHGILHLLGFDDHSPNDIKRMRREEVKILKVLGYDR